MSSSLPIPAGNYGIDTWHTQLGFSVRHLGISTVRGSFDRYTGSLTVGADLATTSVGIEAEMASVNTGNQGRDEHLHGEHFFDVANHPKLTFASTKVSENDGKYALHGDLTIRGITKAVVLDVVFNGSGVFPMDQSTHFGFTATGEINRSDFGVSYAVPVVSETVHLTLDAQFVQPATPAA
jgi:polyisoprenoid-binding protein YceI